MVVIVAAALPSPGGVVAEKLLVEKALVAVPRFFEKLRRVQRPLIRIVQRVILQGSLFLLYYFGFGISRAFMTVFARRTLLHRPRTLPDRDTRWREAEGYDLDPIRLARQS